MRSPPLAPLALVAVLGCKAESSMNTDGSYDADNAYVVSTDTDAPVEVPPEFNPWVATADDDTSTFSVDVDSGSYSLSRRALVGGAKPDPKVVRVEEFMNYFRYDAPRPTDGLPFAVELASAPSVFGDADDIALMRIGIQAKEIPEEERDPVNLVFLLDVSGSMQSGDKLGLVQFAMKSLVNRLQPTDTLGIVVYAGSEGVVLEPTAVEDKSAILDALDALSAGGSTNGEAGIRAAYDLAESAFREDGVNRVVLCSDGDMNVGLEGEALVDLVSGFRDRGIYLTTLGFGTGNYEDAQMEQLADHADGNYAYIDSPNEALRVLGENLVGTLQVVAKDTKVQVEFDPGTVERWRLIGYENRLLEDDQFADDTVDAGDIGAGHSVTALYELDLVTPGAAGRAAEVRLRYKEPGAEESTEHVWTHDGGEMIGSFDAAPDRFRFVAAVAEFAEILRESPHSAGERYADVRAIAAGASAGPLASPSAVELLDLIDRADAL